MTQPATAATLAKAPAVDVGMLIRRPADEVFAATSAVLVGVLFVLGFLSFTVMRTHPFTNMGTPVPSGHIHICHGHCRQAPPPPRAR
jgi:hypothetical protein